MQTILEIALSNAVMVTVLALLAATVSRVCRRPALAHGLWLLVLLKLVTPPLVPVSISWLSLAAIPVELRNASPSPQTLRESFEKWPADSAPALKGTEPPVPGETGENIWLFALAEAAPAEVGSTPPYAHPANLAEVLNAWVQPWFTSIGAPIWLGMSLLWFLCTAIHSFRFQRLLRYARRAPASLQDQARALAARMGLKDYPRIWLVPGAVSPMLWFVGRTPRLLFPAGLLDQLDHEQRATLLVHELAHYRRRDHWVRFVEMLALGLYWWHPVVWWARHELHEAEEQCCDAWVVWTLSGADRAYATAPLQTVAFVSPSRCPLPAADRGIG